MWPALSRQSRRGDRICRCLWRLHRVCPGQRLSARDQQVHDRHAPPDQSRCPLAGRKDVGVLWHDLAGRRFHGTARITGCGVFAPHSSVLIRKGKQTLNKMKKACYPAVNKKIKRLHTDGFSRHVCHLLVIDGIGRFGSSSGHVIDCRGNVAMVRKAVRVDGPSIFWCWNRRKRRQTYDYTQHGRCAALWVRQWTAIGWRRCPSRRIRFWTPVLR